MTCGVEWQPDLAVPGRLHPGWWWCPTDVEHTKAKARTDFGRALHEEELQRGAEPGAGRDNFKPALEYIQMKLNKHCLRRVGIERLDLKTSGRYGARGVTDVHLRCLTCGTEWHPDIRPSIRNLPKGWWWCPADAEHTKAKARTKFGWERHAERLIKAAEAAKEDGGPKQGELF